MEIKKLFPKIDLCQDLVFKAVFTSDTPQSRGALTGLLSAFLGRKLTILSVTTNEPPANDIRLRQIRYDISVIFGNGELANIEMMMNTVPTDPLRMEYYLARLFVGQEIQGTSGAYSELKYTWQLSIAAKGIFFNDDALFHEFTFYDCERNISLGGRTSILTLELEKLDVIENKPALFMTSLERWSVFFRYYPDETKKELLAEILEIEEAIKMAAQVARGFTQTQLAYLQEMHRHKQETLEQEIKYFARQEGLAEGRAEGQKALFALLESGKSIEEAKQILGFEAD